MRSCWQVLNLIRQLVRYRQVRMILFKPSALVRQHPPPSLPLFFRLRASTLLCHATCQESKLPSSLFFIGKLVATFTFPSVITEDIRHIITGITASLEEVMQCFVSRIQNQEQCSDKEKQESLATTCKYFSPLLSLKRQVTAL